MAVHSGSERVVLEGILYVCRAIQQIFPYPTCQRGPHLEGVVVENQRLVNPNIPMGQTP